MVRAWWREEMIWDCEVSRIETSGQALDKDQEENTNLYNIEQQLLSCILIFKWK